MPRWAKIALPVWMTLCVVLGGTRSAWACLYDSDCPMGEVCCGDGNCEDTSCAPSTCTQDTDCPMGDCCYSGTCDTCGVTCTTSTDCPTGECCGGGGTCSPDNCAATCPANDPVDCGNGLCCSSDFPSCCPNGFCGTASDCSDTVPGVAGGVGLAVGGQSDWGCAVGTSTEGSTTWLACVGLMVGLSLGTRRRGRR